MRKKINVYLFYLIKLFSFDCHVNKICIKLFGFIPFLKIKSDRFFVQTKNQFEVFSDAITISNVKKSKNKILIIEPNMKYHSECLSGYIKYFNDLGYKPDVILSYDNYNLQPFIRCNQLSFDTFPIYDYDSLIKLVEDKVFINGYKKILITTSIALSGDIFPAFFDNKKQIMSIIHSLKTIDSMNIKQATNNKCYVLSYFKNNTYPTINPHYFGEVLETQKNEEFVKFISVGRIQKDVKNYDMLVESIRDLIVRGYKNFEVVLIGWHGNMDFDDDVAKYINFKGKLSFDEMFLEMEDADFYLSLLDPNDEKQFEYSYDLATGSNQLVLAFKKPYLINEQFANAYKYSQENAIVYKENNLTEAMINAIEMKQDDYLKIQDNLRKLSQELYSLSIENIKEELND